MNWQYRWPANSPGFAATITCSISGVGRACWPPYIHRAGAHYTGIDTSSTLVRRAVARHGGTKSSRFIHADVGAPERYAARGPFTVAMFLLSIQDIASLDAAFRAVLPLMSPSGRVVIVMTHPCFRIPRVTGWGTDPNRKLVFRRVDGYLTARRIPIRLHGRGAARTVSYHRPLQEYIATLARSAFRVDALVERTMSDEQHRRIVIRGGSARHNADIPVLLGLRATR